MRSSLIDAACKKLKAVYPPSKRGAFATEIFNALEKSNSRDAVSKPTAAINSSSDIQIAAIADSLSEDGSRGDEPISVITAAASSLNLQKIFEEIKTTSSNEVFLSNREKKERYIEIYFTFSYRGADQLYLQAEAEVYKNIIFQE